jgi:imidazolonepropionase
MTLACLQYGWTALEALAAATVNAAHAIGRGGSVGCIAPGSAADLVALDLETLDLLPYRFGDNFVAAVLKHGRLVVDRRGAPKVRDRS